MNFPGPQVYNEALQMAQVSILDPVLRMGRVETDSLGLPFGRAGSFAITFKIAAGGSNHAFRCFLQNRSTIHERYDAISSHLKGIQLPYFVDFTYLEEGIRVDGTVFPAVRMSWAGGIPLGLYIQDHHGDAGRMTALQQQIQGMALALGAAGLAHGDIQGGNLLIGDGGAIKLVDYDGMYVPSIANLGAIETGHPNFQHPGRAHNKPFDAKVDQFSFALMHTVIAALIERPELWSQLNSDPDKILLGESDIASPFSSPAFTALTSLPSTGGFARSLQAIASAPYVAVPEFKDFLNHRNIPPARESLRSTNAKTPKTAPHSAPWYVEYVAEESSVPLETTRGDSRGNYIAAVPVIDGSAPNEWAGRHSEDVEVIGEIQSTEIGESGKGLPYVRLVVHEGTPELTIDVWADGLRRFAEQGVTINDTWCGQWISARGTIQGPIGSPTGERYSMTVAEQHQLERINSQQARSRLASATTAATNLTEASNADALTSLSGKPLKPPQTSPNLTATSQTSPHGVSGNAHSGLSRRADLWIVWGTIGAALLLLLGVLLATGRLDWTSPSTSGTTNLISRDSQIGSSPATYRTCVDIDGEESCEAGNTWEYLVCWQGISSPQDFELQRRQSGDWVRARGITVIRNNCEPRFPWTVQFRQSEAVPGIFEYRIYDTEFNEAAVEITVTVTED